jgi:predicted signal transduction protein with EAL and GGDEF domain
VKAQLLQLDLRQSLCAFIESYVDFAQEKKSKGVEALSRFEMLIFAGISPDVNNIPNTFDGVEQLAKLIKELKLKA